MKKVISSFLALSVLVSTLWVPASAANSSPISSIDDVLEKAVIISSSEDVFEPVSFSVTTNGYTENIYINENREVFVNGRNITTIVSKEPSISVYSVADEEWIEAGTEEWHYDLGGLSVVAVKGILKSLGKEVALTALENILGAYGAIAGAAVIDGVYIKDVRTTYYRNIDKPGRPEMKQTHDLSLVAFGVTVYEF